MDGARSEASTCFGVKRFRTTATTRKPDAPARCEPARAALLYPLEDKRVQSFFLGGKYPKTADPRAVHEALSQAGEAGATRTGLSRASAVPRHRVAQAVNVPARAGAAEGHPG